MPPPVIPGQAPAPQNGVAPNRQAVQQPAMQPAQQVQPPQTFDQTFNELSGNNVGAQGHREPGSQAYQPALAAPAVPFSQPVPSAAPLPPASPSTAPLPTPGQLPPGVQPQPLPQALPSGATVNPSRSIVEGMQSRGYQIPGDWNDDLLLGELGQLVEQLQDAPTPEEYQRYKQLAPQLYEFAQQRPEFDKWKQAQQGTGGPGAGPQQPAPGNPQQPAGLQAPSVDPFAQKLIGLGEITRDAKGIYTASRPELHGYAVQLNDRESYVEKFRSEFDSDPHGFIQKALDPIIAEKVKPYEDQIKQLSGQISQQAQETSAGHISRYFEDNHQRFWATDQKGNQVFGSDGLPMMTAAGNVYANTVKSLESAITDPLQRHKAAVEVVDGAFTQPQTVMPPGDAQGVAYDQDPPMQQQFAQQQFAQQPAQQQQHARNVNFLQRNRINQQFSRMPVAGYSNQMAQGSETPDGANSFDYLFDQEEALKG